MLLNYIANITCDSFLALVYPQACALCGESVESRVFGVACSDCWEQTQVFDGSEKVCWKCGLPSGGSVTQSNQESIRCGRCEAENFSAARACGAYEGALRASVLSLKRQPYICRRVIELLTKVQKCEPLRTSTLIVPVPLHPEREKIRGYNQAAVIARAVSSAASLPLDERALVRTKHTERHRAGMDAQDRRNTVAKSFLVSCPAVVAGERVLLIDDVFTTGATVSSCAEALRAAGAEEIFALTIARAMRF